MATKNIFFQVKIRYVTSFPGVSYSRCALVELGGEEVTLYMHNTCIYLIYKYITYLLYPLYAIYCLYCLYCLYISMTFSVPGKKPHLLCTAIIAGDEFRAQTLAVEPI